jgi:preprotein translocase subunit SecF
MQIPVNQQRAQWWSISGLIIVTGIMAMVFCWTQFQTPLRPGLDFVGGTRLLLERNCQQPQICAQPLNLGDIRAALAEKGLANSSIQIVGENKQAVSIRTPPLDEEKRTPLVDGLDQRFGPFDKAKTQIDTVGPTLGKELLTNGLLALLISFVGISLYLTIRFEFDYAVWAIVALAHDVLVTLGAFALLGVVLGVEVDSLFIVSLLTIIGFSVNDTVVIYDRVRENLTRTPDLPLREVVDVAVNQTLTRSINTSLTTMLPLVAIFLFGGETLKYFALALLVGFTSGVYSSIFIASTLFTWWRERSKPALP